MSSDTYSRFEEHVSYRMNKNGKPMPLPFILLGLLGESGELKECLELDKGREDTLSELGDALWYFQAACSTLGIDFSKMHPIMTFVGITVDLGYVAEMGKKIAWHGKTFETSEWELRLANVLGHLFAISVFTGISFEEAMLANIEKLEKRYPRGFVEGGGIRESALVTTYSTGGYDANGAYVHG